MDAKTESAPKPGDEMTQRQADQQGVAAERPVPAPTIVDEAAAGVAGEAPPPLPEREGDEGLAKPPAAIDKAQAEAKAQAEEKANAAMKDDDGVDPKVSPVAFASLPPPDAPHPAVAELEGVAAQHGHRISIANAEKSALPIYPVVIDKLNRLWRYEEGPDGEYLVMVGTARV